MHTEHNYYREPARNLPADPAAAREAAAARLRKRNCMVAEGGDLAFDRGDAGFMRARRVVVPCFALLCRGRGRSKNRRGGSGET